MNNETFNYENLVRYYQTHVYHKPYIHIIRDCHSLDKQPETGKHTHKFSTPNNKANYVT